MMGSVDFLGGCPAGSHPESSKIEHWHYKNPALLNIIMSFIMYLTIQLKL